MDAKREKLNNKHSHQKRIDAQARMKIYHHSIMTSISLSGNVAAKRRKSNRNCVRHTFRNHSTRKQPKNWITNNAFRTALSLIVICYRGECICLRESFRVWMVDRQSELIFRYFSSCVCVFAVLKILAAAMEKSEVNAGASTSEGKPPADLRNEFHNTGRVGRRNAMPDILDDHCTITTADLPDQLSGLSTNEPGTSTSMPGTSQSPGPSTTSWIHLRAEQSCSNFALRNKPTSETIFGHYFRTRYF